MVLDGLEKLADVASGKNTSKLLANEEGMTRLKTLEKKAGRLGSMVHVHIE